MKKRTMPMLPAFDREIKQPNESTTTAQRINTITRHVAHPASQSTRQNHTADVASPTRHQHATRHQQPPSIKRHHMQAKGDGSMRNSFLRAHFNTIHGKPAAYRDLTKELKEQAARPPKRLKANL